jgi:hypothetical protein
MAGLAFRVCQGPLTDRFVWHGSTSKRDVTKSRTHSTLRHHPSDAVSGVSTERGLRPRGAESDGKETLTFQYFIRLARECPENGGMTTREVRPVGSDSRLGERGCDGYCG